MIELKIPKEIKDYKTKFLFGLTLRQNIALGLMLIINVSIYKFGSGYLNEDTLQWLIIIVSVPFIAVGFFRYNSMNIEDFIKAYIQSEIIYPQKRVYKTDNPISKIRKKFLIEERKKEVEEEKKKRTQEKYQKRQERLKNNIIVKKIMSKENRKDDTDNKRKVESK